MANYTQLLAAIRAAIKQNGTNDITGQLMQDTLTTIVGTLGRFAQFAGVAIPSTNPGTPDQTVFYLATQVGTYVNFGGVTISGTRICVIHNINGAWKLLVIITLGDGSAVEIDPVLDPTSLNPVENRAVYAECQAIRALIAEVSPVQSIKSVYYTNEQANAITGETFNSKIILAFTATVTGAEGVIISNAKQSGNNVLRVYGTAFDGNTMTQRIYTLSDSATLQNAIGVNNSLDGGALIVYAE